MSYTALGVLAGLLVGLLLLAAQAYLKKKGGKK